MHTTEAMDVLYGGADLHGNNVFLSICNASGKTVFKRRVKANLDAVNTALSPYWPKLKTLAVESTYNWYWFVDGLRDQGRDIRLANPAKMDQYEGLKSADDASDACWLAEQVRLGILPECYIYPKDVRPIRDALRRRQLFVRQRTQTLLSLEAFLARQGFDNPGAGAIKAWTNQEVRALGLEAFGHLQVSSLLKSVQQSDALAQEIEQAVLAKVKKTRDFDRIQQVSGLGPILGLTVLLESGAFARFPSAGHYASYCRAVKTQRTSNGKKKGHNNGKNGNPYLAWAFVEAASHATRHYPKITAWYERKKRRRNTAVALKALACKLSKAVWHVMHGKDFDEKMLFG
jgi:transposase